MKARLARSLLGMLFMVVASGSAHAAYYSIDFAYTFEPSEFSGTVLGEVGPATLTAHMVIDGSAPQYSVSGLGVHGYGLGAITNFSASFGTGSWAAADLIPFGSTPAVVVFDGVLSDGATLGIAFQASNPDRDLAVAVFATPVASVLDEDGSGNVLGDTFSMRTVPRAVVSAVPAPSTVLLIGIGLMALAGMNVWGQSKRGLDGENN